jgi:NAD-dependent dihydropyrimidine dehydrogenase PreA subunit
MKRTIIKIDEKKCNGCGVCVKGCHEGALQLINNKAVMVSDLYCDGLGACIGDCPVGAISLEEREAQPYDETAVMKRLVPKGEKVIRAHFKHLKEHGETALYQQGVAYLKQHHLSFNLNEEPEKPKLACGCPGTMERSFAALTPLPNAQAVAPQSSALRQFPVQLHLLNPQASFLQNSNLLLAADCTAFASGEFHSRFLQGKSLAIACPKLDHNIPLYIEKLTSMIDDARLDTLTVLIMEVPCCGGLIRIAKAARDQANRNIPIKQIVLSVRGEVVSEEWI